MKDKRRKYDLSYFIKDGGKPIDTSPSVNASEMNSEEMKRRNNNLNRELREMENPEEENARNNSFVNQERNNAAQPANQVNNSNNDNNENKGNSREPFTKPKNEEEVVAEESSREPEPEINAVIPASEESSREAQIKAEIAESESRLGTLMREFSLESHRNRPEFDTTRANINSPGAAAMNRAFDVNNKRREAREKAELKKERDARRLEKAGEGVEANTAIETKKVQGQSASEKTPSLKNRANRFFRLIATSIRPSDLSSNDLYQFSQNLLNYIEWARINLLTKEQRSEFANLRPEQLLTRLPINLRELFQRIRSERNRLRSEILRLNSISPPVLPASASASVSAPSPASASVPAPSLAPSPASVPSPSPASASVSVPSPASASVSASASASASASDQNIMVPPIWVNVKGRTSPPNNGFNVSKLKIKDEDKEKIKPSSIKIKKMSPENIQKKINENAKKLSNQANMSKEVHTQKILRNRNKFITEISEKLNKFKNWDKSEYIKFQLSELQDETDTQKIIRIIQELEFLLKEKEFQNIHLNKSYKNKDQFISKIRAELEKLKKLKKLKFTDEETEQIEELIEKINSLKEGNSFEIIELMDNLKKIIDEKKEELNKKWLENTSNILESSKDGLLRLKSLTIPRLLKKLNKTPPDQEEEIEELTSLITKLKDKELKDKELKYEELRKNLKNMNNAKKVNEEYKNEIERLKKASENKKEREEEERIREEEEKEKERSRDPKKILKKIKEEQQRILGNKMAREKQIKDLDKNETLTQLRRKKTSSFLALTPKEKKFLETKEKKIEELRIEKDKLEKKSEELIQESKELTQEINKLKSEKKSKQKQEEINIQISNKNSILIDQILNTQQELYKADTEEKKSALRKRKTELFKQIESNKKGNSHRYLKEVRETISKGFKKLNLQDLKEKYAELYNKGEEIIKSNNKNKKLALQKEVDILTQEKHSKNIEKIFDTHKKMLEAKTSIGKSQLADKRKNLFQEIEKNSQNNHKYLKDVREAITKGFKELNYKYVEKEFANLITLTDKMNNSNNNNKIKIKNQIKKIIAKLKADQLIDKQNMKKFLNKYTNFVNSKEIESRAKKTLKIIENSKKVIQDKHIESSEEKNLFKRYLKNSLSLVDDKNKAELEKLYKKLNTEEIKIFPKTKKKYQELIQKYKNIEKTKLEKLNRTTNELATPNIKQVQKFKPKPEISPWEKVTKKDSKKLTKPVKPTKPIRQTFSKDSGKVMNGVSYKNKLKFTEQPVQSSSQLKDNSKKPVQSSYQLEDNSGFKRVLTENEKKIIKLIRKLPSKKIKIADIKSAISSFKNNEIKKQLRGLLEQKLISITRK